MGWVFFIGPRTGCWARGQSGGRSVKQTPAVAYRRDAHVTKVIGRELRQQRSIDIVVNKELGVLRQTEAGEPRGQIGVRWVTHVER